MASSKKDRDGLYLRGGVYYCWVRGKRYSTRCRTRKAALAARGEIERSIVDPVYWASQSAKVGELCAVTIAEVQRRGRSEATVEYYRSKLGQVVRGLGEGTVLADLSVDIIDGYIDKRRAEGASQHTLSKELGAIRHMLRVAKRRKQFSGDIEALFPIGFASGYEPRRSSLALDEIPMLLPRLAPRWRGWAAYCIASGGRKSEVGRAERNDVSSDLRIVQVRGRKTQLSDDAVAVPEVYRPLLALALELGAPEGPMFGNWRNAVRDLADACEAAGIERVTPNDLRRTHSTLLRVAGLSIDLIARQLRHADTRMAEKVYARLTARQVVPLLPSAITVQGQLTPDPDGTITDYLPCELTNDSAGVDDENRTRDNWSHKPEAHKLYVAFRGDVGVDPSSGPWTTWPASTTNSTDFGGASSNPPEQEAAAVAGARFEADVSLGRGQQPGPPVGTPLPLVDRQPGNVAGEASCETTRTGGSNSEDVTAGRDPLHSPASWALAFAGREMGVIANG